MFYECFIFTFSFAYLVIPGFRNNPNNYIIMWSCPGKGKCQNITQV